MVDTDYMRLVGDWREEREYMKQVDKLLEDTKNALEGEGFEVTVHKPEYNDNVSFRFDTNEHGRLFIYG